MLTGIPSALRRTFDDGTIIQLEVNDDNIKLWKRLAFASVTELKSDGLGDVANSVIRRAIMEGTMKWGLPREGEYFVLAGVVLGTILLLIAGFLTIAFIQ